MNDAAAIISDIHGNLPALRAVLEDIDQMGIRERVCLGDVVGYGAQPAECIELLRRSGFDVVLRGNHDAYVSTEGPVPGLNPETARAIEWTREVLSGDDRTWLGQLPMTWTAPDYEAVHASLHQPEEWNYVLNASAAALHFAQQQKRLCFIGHSHRPAMFVEGDEQALDITSLESLRTDRKQVVNVGSVGQPRDKDERACYVIYRREKQDVWWRIVAYDVSAAQSAILSAGLPMKFAQRLSYGK